ncbi:MAG TPA: M48 family metalloprotease [Candidatus Dormibacteraeota bacterium]|nr:M48 family metalloprotease [Candidatus Dormibacteraeota bacterium]
MNFAEQQRRNRQRTVLLIGAFVALFATVGALLDLTVVGAPLPVATLTALLVAGATSVLGWRHGANWVLASLLAEPLRDDDPEHRQLANIASEMAIAAGLPRPRLFVIPDPSPNALAAGAGPTDAAIAVTAGALALLDREETQGVVAHEMAHIANRDSALMTLVSVLFGGLLMLADWARRSLFFARQGNRAVNPLAVVLLPLLVLLTPLLSRLLAMAVSRRREYQADATAVELTRNPEGLARALEKIAGSEFPLRAATRGSAHLFIVSPLRHHADDADDSWASLFATHPPLAQRVALLRGLAEH